MNQESVAQRVAVCSWSLQPVDPQDLLTKLQSVGIRRVQLALDPLRESPELLAQTTALFRDNGIAIVSGMFGCAGEDYSTPETIRRTGGVAPDATWQANLQNIKKTAALATRLGLKLVTFHAGFLPEDESTPDFAKILGRLTEVADIFGKENLMLGLETGQESAEALAGLLDRINRPNLGVNFDPANMILYNQGNPVEALRVLSAWLRQVHIKDGKRTKTPGTWGQEVQVGTGEVDWRAFFATLKALGYSGDFVIEREAGGRRAGDILAAKSIIERSLA